jgi:hypothetical protein
VPAIDCQNGCRSQWLPAEPGWLPHGDGDGSTLEAADAADQENADPNADPNTEPTVPVPEVKDTSKSGHSLQPTGKCFTQPLLQETDKAWLIEL